MLKPLIEMQGITKTFPGVIANDDVNLQLFRSEIHVLLGENGAGKSTLMSVLSGLYKPNAGKIFINGEHVVFHNPKDAINGGIGMVHQHFKLVGAFSVAQNVILGARKGMFIDEKTIEKEIQDFAEKYNIDIDVKTKVSLLSIGEQQRVEILKALYREADLLVLDEPTAVLTPQETDVLFATLRGMANMGKSIVVITHKMAEVMAIADKVTILRRGKTVANFVREELDSTVLSETMVGETIVRTVPLACEVGSPLLELKNVTALNDRGTNALENASFVLHEGEIVGVAGVSGNGQKELLEAIAGLRKVESGEILLTPPGKPDVRIENIGVKGCLAEGIAFIPEDRLGMGLVGNMHLVDNMILRNDCHSVWLPYTKAESDSKSAVSQYEISVANIKSPLRLLSGGNLQKVLVAREISNNPHVLLVAYPVRGLDIAATDRVYNLLLDQRKKKCGILMVSEDLDSLIAYSDRILVMCGGKISGCIPKSQATPKRLGLMMMGEAPKEEWLNAL